MKTYFKLVVSIALGALLAGCAGMRSGVVLDPVGPTPASPAQANSGSGTLIVYSAYQVNANFNYSDPNRRVHSDYKILDQDGKLVTRVHNATEDILKSAVQVTLPAGKYSVVARSNGYGIVTVPVIIEAGRETILHLEGGYKWPDENEFNDANAVRLPDGEIVGWKGTSADR